MQIGTFFMEMDKVRWMIRDSIPFSIVHLTSYMRYYPFGIVGLISTLLGSVLAGMASKSTISFPISSG